MKTKKILWKNFRETYLHHIGTETLATAFQVHRNTITNWDKASNPPDHVVAQVILRLANLIHEGYITRYQPSGMPNIEPAVVMSEIIEMLTFIEAARKCKKDGGPAEAKLKAYELQITVIQLAHGKFNNRIGFKFPIEDDYTEKDLQIITRPVREREVILFD